MFRKHPGHHRPPHLLCHGFERASCPERGVGQPEAPPSLSGLVNRHPNSYAEAVKGPVWSALLVALGPGGDRIMIELLMNCGVFASLDGPSGTCYQLSGKFLGRPFSIYLRRRQENHWRTLNPFCRTRTCRINLRRAKFLSLLRDLKSLGTRVLTALRQSPLSEAACSMPGLPLMRKAKCVLAFVISVMRLGFSVAIHTNTPRCPQSSLRSLISEADGAHFEIHFSAAIRSS